MADRRVQQEKDDGSILNAVQPTNESDNLSPRNSDFVRGPVPDNLNPRQEVQMGGGHDGPLFLALLMGNNNLNAAAQQGAAQPQPVPDTLDLRSTTKAKAAGVFSVAVKELIAPPRTVKPVLRLRGLSSESYPGQLSEEQLQFWRDEGYLVVPDALPTEDVAELLRSVHESAEILANSDDKRVKLHTYEEGQDHYVSPIGRLLALPSNGKHLNPKVKEVS